MLRRRAGGEKTSIMMIRFVFSFTLVCAIGLAAFAGEAPAEKAASPNSAAVTASDSTAKAAEPAAGKAAASDSTGKAGEAAEPAAGKAAPEPVPLEDVAAAITGFASDDVAVRLASLETVVKAGKPAVPLLEEALEVKSPLMKVYACRALGGIKDADSRPRLVTLLESAESPALRVAAAEAVAGFGDKAALEALRKAATDRDPYVRSRATLAIASIRSKEAIDLLVWLLKADAVAGRVAADCLRSITLHDFGTSHEQWTKWWLENRGQGTMINDQ